MTDNKQPETGLSDNAGCARLKGLSFTETSHLNAKLEFPDVHTQSVVFTRDSIYAIARIVDCRKMVEVRMIKFSPYGNPVPLVFAQ